MNRNTREEALEEIREILAIDADNVSLKRINQYTQQHKEKSYFVKAIVKENLPYAAFNDGEEMLLWQLKRTFKPKYKQLQKECAESIASNVNRLIELRDNQVYPKC
ncbi:MULTISPECIES: hypothetical protein [Enterococcus]|uniref:hypothetical protein n=1 Tax=Enterococcus TaxID=1350 RepID=UPI000A33F722|nr:MULTISPECIES: hypothetical protein [Enterococcus]MBO0423360.1 hypothetical protein [Enterococcus plantarum]OTN83817.1 hypothetical protein A5819_003636 [Enterococcus sp. 7E2_DIV0204]OTP47531.1 hypothetical protein A5884_003502 [Enterococcus sp. 7D2_DIV0200]